MNRFQRWRLARQLRRDYQEWSQGHAKPMIIAPDHKYVARSMRTAMEGERRRIAGALEAWGKLNGPYEQQIADYLIDQIVQPKDPLLTPEGQEGAQTRYDEAIDLIGEEPAK